MNPLNWPQIMRQAETAPSDPAWRIGDDGLSGIKLLNLLTNLAQLQMLDKGRCYLEVGVFRGLSLTSVAAKAQGGAAYGIDNFSQFDPENRNRNHVLSLINTMKLSNACLIDEDYETALPRLDKWIGDSKVALYFVDGPHDYRSQLMCLLLALPHLSADAIIVVDDSNYEHVRLANADFIAANPDFSLAIEAYTEGHPEYGGPQRLAEARSGWWNGVNVIARNRSGPALSLQIGDGRMRAEALHMIQSSSLFDKWSEIESDLRALNKGSFLQRLWRTASFSRRLKSLPIDDSSPNTHSRHLETRATAADW